MIPLEIFPPGVVMAASEDWMWETPARPEEELLLSTTAVEKRQREFRAGRHCAHRILQELGFPDHAVLRGEGGEPLWPAGVCGSISHAASQCMAIAAHIKDYVSLGIDIERDRFIKDDTLERISFEHERLELISAPEEFSAVNLRAILFSIKECVHKVYYPLNRHTLDFQDVAVTFNWPMKSFFIRIMHPAKNPMYPIENLSGSFGYAENYVYARICLRKDFSCA